MDLEKQTIADPQTASTKQADEGWMALALPILVTLAVSIACITGYHRFFGEAQAANDATTPKVLILTLKDWIGALPEDASPEDMSAHFKKARMAAERAAIEGYIVLNEAQAVAFPQSARLVPGMFEAPSEATATTTPGTESQTAVQHSEQSGEVGE